MCDMLMTVVLVPLSSIRKSTLPIKNIGRSYGHTSQPQKGLLVRSDRNLSSAKSVYKRFGMKVVTGCRCHGDFIGSSTHRFDWLKQKACFQEEEVITMARASKKYLHNAYVAIPSRATCSSHSK